MLAPWLATSRAARATRATRQLSVSLGVLLALAGHAVQARAQAVVQGTVMDSLAGRPLASAVVQLAAVDGSDWSRRATADSAGRFRIAGVPAGRYLLGFTHSRVDALGLALPPAAVHVAAGDTLLRADVGVPSARTIVAHVCGARPDSAALVLGRVLDASTARPVGAARVIVRAPGAPARATDADDDGRFAACAAPAGAPLTVQAIAGDARGKPEELRVAPGSVVEHDLRVPTGAAAPARAAPAQPGTARLTGRVRDRDGAVVSDALVVVRGTGVADSVARSAADGRFSLAALPAGTFAVEVRAIGRQPARAQVELESDRSVSVELALGERITVLEPVRVSAAAEESDWTGFTRRAKSGRGRFIGESDIDKLHPQTVPDLLRTVPGLRVERDPFTGTATVYSRGYANLRQRCTPAVFLDGILADDGASALEHYVQPSEIHGIEIYLDAAGTPSPFQRGLCGSVVIWTKWKPSKP